MMGGLGEPRDRQGDGQEPQEPQEPHPGGGWESVAHRLELEAAAAMFRAGMLGNDEAGQRAYRYLRWLIRNGQAEVYFDPMSRSGSIVARGVWRSVASFVAMANEDGQGDSAHGRGLFR